MPWPSSHLPVDAVTVPSAPTAIQESRRVGSMCEARVSNGPCTGATAWPPLASIGCRALNATTRAPEVFRKSRREIAVVMSRLLRVAPDGAQHPNVREAPAQDARHRPCDLRLRGPGV